MINIFDNFDLDKDGALDLVELKNFVNHMGFQISDTRIRRVLYFFRDDEGLELITFIDFIRIFIPSTWSQEKIYEYFQNI